MRCFNRLWLLFFFSFSVCLCHGAPKRVYDSMRKRMAADPVDADASESVANPSGSSSSRSMRQRMLEAETCSAEPPGATPLIVKWKVDRGNGKLSSKDIYEYAQAVIKQGTPGCEAFASGGDLTNSPQHCQKLLVRIFGNVIDIMV